VGSESILWLSFSQQKQQEKNSFSIGGEDFAAEARTCKLRQLLTEKLFMTFFEK
jgi:hypothetical protein